MKVFNVPSYLEDLTGLTQLLQDTRVSEVSRTCMIMKRYWYLKCRIHSERTDVSLEEVLILKGTVWAL